MRVLFKEDDPLVARTLERQLRKLGHATEQIVDFRSLLNGKCELHPDVIITDIFMRCCQSNRNSSPIGEVRPSPLVDQAMRFCHSASAAERAVL